VLHRSDITVDLSTGRVEYCGSKGVPPWRVTLVDTGPDSMTGGRLRRVRDHVADDTFCMTYGDGVGNVDITRLIEQHRKSGLDATLTAAVPPGRYGATVIADGRVTKFTEKPAGDGGHINGGFFVLEPRVIDRISGDSTVWEAEPLQGLAQDGQLGSYIHAGFWQPMDTLRDKNQLESLWASGRAPWKVW
jgi:glucose-1-phosphate cytidylyltransferase